MRRLSLNRHQSVRLLMIAVMVASLLLTLRLLVRNADGPNKAVTDQTLIAAQPQAVLDDSPADAAASYAATITPVLPVGWIVQVHRGASATVVAVRRQQPVDMATISTDPFPPATLPSGPYGLPGQRPAEAQSDSAATQPSPVVRPHVNAALAERRFNYLTGQSADPPMWALPSPETASDTGAPSAEVFQFNLEFSPTMSNVQYRRMVHAHLAAHKQVLVARQQLQQHVGPTHLDDFVPSTEAARTLLAHYRAAQSRRAPFLGQPQFFFGQHPVAISVLPWPRRLSIIVNQDEAHEIDQVGQLLVDNLLPWSQRLPVTEDGQVDLPALADLLTLHVGGTWSVVEATDQDNLPHIAGQMRVRVQASAPFPVWGGERYTIIPLPFQGENRYRLDYYRSRYTYNVLSSNQHLTLLSQYGSANEYPSPIATFLGLQPPKGINGLFLVRMMREKPNVLQGLRLVIMPHDHTAIHPLELKVRNYESRNVIAQGATSIIIPAQQALALLEYLIDNDLMAPSPETPRPEQPSNLVVVGWYLANTWHGNLGDSQTAANHLRNLQALATGAPAEAIAHLRQQLQQAQPPRANRDTIKRGCRGIWRRGHGKRSGRLSANGGVIMA